MMDVMMDVMFSDKTLVNMLLIAIAIKFLRLLASRKSREHVCAFIERAIHGTLISHISASTRADLSIEDDIQGAVLKMNKGKDDNGLLMG